MKKQLSILIPIYNESCVSLVEQLHRQAEELSIDYEIIVADDGSTVEASKVDNRRINSLSHCSFWERGYNVGRAAIRNALVGRSQYSRLLLIDGDLSVARNDFLRRYLSTEGDVVVGGIEIAADTEGRLKGNLRFIYEKRNESLHTPDKRRAKPYDDFHTANFLICRSVMLANLFDERFSRYGYEDVALGRQLKLSKASIVHIDNPVLFNRFESNESFIAKTDQAMLTLVELKPLLVGVSRLLDTAFMLRRYRLDLPLRLVFSLLRVPIRMNLCSSRPLLPLYNIYKLGVLLSNRNLFVGGR